MNLDILAIGSHPDDVELYMAGSLLVFARAGRKTGVVDLTQGELGSRGSADLRSKEAAEAAKILKLSARENLGLPDGSVTDDSQSRLAVIRVLRKYRPKIVFTHHREDRSGHPDHRACSQLVQHAVYLSGLHKINTEQERYRPQALIFFGVPRWLFPSFVIDVSEVYQEGRRAMAAYRSQFHDPKSREPETRLSHPRFLDNVEVGHRYYGALVGSEFGDAFWCERPLRLVDPTLHFL